MNRSTIAENASLYEKNKYVVEKVEPDTIAFSSKFYANNHIPTIQNRPGNNTINNTLYEKYSPNYNLFCLK